MIVDQIREEAKVIADSMVLEIFDRAAKSLVATRFVRLRKKLSFAQNEIERDYIHALNLYVKHKILYKKRIENVYPLHKASLSEECSYHKRQMSFWRVEMDRIEFGLGTAKLQRYTSLMLGYSGTSNSIPCMKFLYKTSGESLGWS